MFLLTVTALGANLGWPCSRMNWAWRNVWSTCSINSYIPSNTAADFHAPAFWNQAPIHADLAPTTFLDLTGKIAPSAPAGGGGTPSMFCSALANTGSGTYALLRNRCRRAIDAYGGIVKACTLAPAVTGGEVGPVANSIYTDWAPAATHEPHVDNVALLQTNAHQCYVDAGAQVQSPATTCPGLLGWFTVVWNACNMKTYAPEIGADALTAPLGHTIKAANLYLDNSATIEDSPGGATGPKFIFCAPNDVSPASWNKRGPTFRSTRCRKALDQFGRTAARCGTNFPSAADVPTLGSADLLKVMFRGADAATAPNGLLQIAPLCN